MNLQEITIMLATSGGITTFWGTFGAWQYRKQNKRLKEAETKLAEVNVEKAKIEGKSDEFHIWKEQFESLSQLNHTLTERNEKLVQMNAEKEDRLTVSSRRGSLSSTVCAPQIPHSRYSAKAGYAALTPSATAGCLTTAPG